MAARGSSGPQTVRRSSVRLDDGSIRTIAAGETFFDLGLGPGGAALYAVTDPSGGSRFELVDLLSGRRFPDLPLDVASGAARRIEAGGLVHWGGEGPRAFEGCGPAAAGTFCVRGIDTGAMRVVYQLPPLFWPGADAWSPDGRTIAKWELARCDDSPSFVCYPFRAPRRHRRRARGGRPSSPRAPTSLGRWRSRPTARASRTSSGRASASGPRPESGPRTAIVARLPLGRSPQLRRQQRPVCAEVTAPAAAAATACRGRCRRSRPAGGAPGRPATRRA